MTMIPTELHTELEAALIEAMRVPCDLRFEDRRCGRPAEWSATMHCGSDARKRFVHLLCDPCRRMSIEDQLQCSDHKAPIVLERCERL